eukprot:6196861-Pleurochrysis_carterae.AAC.1
MCRAVCCKDQRIQGNAAAGKPFSQLQSSCWALSHVIVIQEVPLGAQGGHRARRAHDAPGAAVASLPRLACRAAC